MRDTGDTTLVRWEHRGKLMIDRIYSCHGRTSQSRSHLPSFQDNQTFAHLLGNPCQMTIMTRIALVLLRTIHSTLLGLPALNLDLLDVVCSIEIEIPRASPPE